MAACKHVQKAKHCTEERARMPTVAFVRRPTSTCVYRQLLWSQDSGTVALPSPSRPAHAGILTGTAAAAVAGAAAAPLHLPAAG
jgi:hypothetical protein